MNRAQGFAHVVEFSRSDREMRRERKEKLCHFYVKIFVGIVLFAVFYILFGYIGKWLWYYHDESDVSYNIADWKQVTGALVGFYVCFFMWWLVTKYCPNCNQYSSYERRSVEQRKFCCYQLGLVAGIICFAGLAKLMEFTFER